MRLSIIRNFHDTPFGAHQGQKRTIELLKKRYYWPKMKSDIEEYISKCISCNERKTGKLPLAPLQNFGPVLEPFELVSMDLVGPLPKTVNGNVYLLTFMDAFTKYSKAIPIPDQTAETVAREFVTHIVTRHGTPKRLLTDQGRNFVSKLFKETCKLLQIKKIQTSPYHPMCNGLVERSHHTLSDMLSHFVNKDQRNWDKWVPLVQMAYRSTPHSITRYSPYFLLHGREMKLPFPIDVTPKFSRHEIMDENVQDLADKLEAAYKLVRSRMSQGKIKQAKYYNDKSNVKFRSFKPGDLIFMHSPVLKKGVTKKLHKPWLGPFKVLEKINEVNYRVEFKNGKTQVIHVNRMKPCLTGSARLKEMDEVSDLSDAETIKLYDTDESAAEVEMKEDKIPLEKPPARVEAGKARPEYDDWSSEDDIPLSHFVGKSGDPEYGYSEAESESGDSEDNVPISQLRERIRAQKAHETVVRVPREVHRPKPRPDPCSVSNHEMMSTTHETNDRQFDTCLKPDEPVTPLLPEPQTSGLSFSLEPKYNLRSRQVYQISFQGPWPC